MSDRYAPLDEELVEFIAYTLGDQKMDRVDVVVEEIREKTPAGIVLYDSFCELPNRQREFAAWRAKRLSRAA